MIYLQAELILANLLCHNDFVTTIDIAQYCKRLKETILNKTGEEYVYSEMNGDAIAAALRSYNDIWKERGSNIYREKDYRVEYFNNRIIKEIAEILEEESRKLKKCICVEQCDCENPPPSDWDGKSGVWHMSNECPIHNLSPDPHPDCLAHSTYRVW